VVVGYQNNPIAVASLRLFCVLPLQLIHGEGRCLRGLGGTAVSGIWCQELALSLGPC